MTKFVGFELNYGSLARVNPAAVSFMQEAGRGETHIHLIGGGSIQVKGDIDTVERVLGAVSNDPRRI